MRVLVDGLPAAVYALRGEGVFVRDGGEYTRNFDLVVGAADSAKGLVDKVVSARCVGIPHVLLFFPRIPKYSRRLLGDIVPYLRQYVSGLRFDDHTLKLSDYGPLSGGLGVLRISAVGLKAPPVISPCPANWENMVWTEGVIGESPKGECLINERGRAIEPGKPVVTGRSYVYSDGRYLYQLGSRFVARLAGVPERYVVGDPWHWLDLSAPPAVIRAYSRSFYPSRREVERREAILSSLDWQQRRIWRQYARSRQVGEAVC